MADKILLEPKQELRIGRVFILPLLAFLVLIGISFVLPRVIEVKATAQVIEKVDERKLEVQVLSPTRTTINPSTEVTVISNKELSLNSEKVGMQYIASKEGKRYYVVRLEKLTVGKTTIKLKFTDSIGAEFEQTLNITREPYGFPPGFDYIGPWENSSYTVDGDNLNALVDKKNRLFEDYEPDDLIDLNKELGLFTLNNARIRSEAAFALRDMLRELAKDTGKYVTVASGYRSYQTQARTYASWVRELGEEGANGVSARPGHSEHQLGTTIDFVSEDTDWKISNTFGDTVAGKWLAENAHRFGFVIPYNEDQTDAGGYKEESWHFRYTGSQTNG